MNPKFKAFMIKAGLSGLFAVLMGYTYKGQLKLEDKIDEKYAKEKADDSEPVS